MDTGENAELLYYPLKIAKNFGGIHPAEPKVKPYGGIHFVDLRITFHINSQ